MEAQAKNTDKAFAKLGLTMDGVSSRSRVNQLNQTSRTMRTLGNDADNMGRGLANLDRNQKKADVSGRGLHGTLRRLVPALKDTFGILFKIGKTGGTAIGFATAIGLAGQAVGQLAGGSIALTSRLLDMGGAAAALIPAYVGLAGAMLQVHQITKGLTAVMGGGTAGAQALRQMGSAAAPLVRQLRSARFEMRELRRAGTTPVLRSLAQGFPAIRQRAFPVLRGVNAQIGGALGQVTTQAIGMLTQRDTLRNIRGIGGQSATMLRAAGDAGVHFAHALTIVGAAAKPLTDFLSRSVRSLGLWADRSAIAGQRSGRLANYFERVTRQTRQMFRFISNAGHALMQLFRDARPAGDILYRDLLRVSEGWRRSADNIDRNRKLTVAFVKMVPGIEAMARLLTHVGGVLFRMGSSGNGLERTVNALDRSLPALERFFTGMANTFGPGFGQLITNLSTTLELLGGQGGPLVGVLNAMNGVLSAVNGILRAIGPFRGVIAKAFEVGLILRFLSKMGLITLAWQRATIAAGEYAAVSGGALGGGVGPTIGLGRRFGFLRRGGGAAATAGEGGFLLRSMSRGAPAAAAGASRLGLLAGLGRAGGMARIGLGVAGRLALPLAAIQGIFGGLTAQRSGGFGNQAAQTLYGAVNGTTGGLLGAGLGAFGVHPLQTPDQVTGRLTGLASQRLTRAGVNDQNVSHEGIRRLNRDVDLLQYTMRSFANDQTDAARNYRAQLQQEIDMRKALVSQIQAEAAARGADRGNAVVQGLNQVWNQTKGGPAAKSAAVVASAMDQLRRAPGTGVEAVRRRQQIENGVLGGPITAAARSSARAQITAFERRQGGGFAIGGEGRAMRVLRGGQGERDIQRSKMTLPGELQLEKRDTTGFTNEQQYLIANLVASGFKRSTAEGWVRDWEKRGNRGDIIPAATRAYWNQQRRRRARRRSNRAGRAAGLDPPVADPGDPSIGMRARAQGMNAIYGLGYAGGGRLGGRGLGDTVPVPGGMAAPGELVVNRHTERRANSVLSRAGMTLGGMVEGEGRRHSDAFATGGRVNWFGHPALTGKIADVAGIMESRFPGLSISATTNGNHVNGSYHYKGEAIDMAAPMDAAGIGLMNRAGAWAQDNLVGSLIEGIHNPTLSVKNYAGVPPFFWGGATWSGHTNHIHLAASNAGQVTTQGGAPGQAAAGGSTAGGGGANAGMSRAAILRAQTAPYNIRNVLTGSRDLSGLGGVSALGNQAPFGGVPSSAGGGGNAGSPNNVGGVTPITGGAGAFALGLAKATGLDPSVTSKWVTRENNGGGANNWLNVSKGPGGKGYSGVRELPGKLAQFASFVNPTDALTETAYWINQMSNYRGIAASAGGSPAAQLAAIVASPWDSTHYGGRLARGGRMGWGGWHARGMSGTFSSPTLIGVGEGGKEHVTVTPAGKGRGGTVTMHNVFHINGANGDTQAQIERALHTFADQLDRHFGNDDGSEVYA